ncbi:hypothetical protein PoB_004575700 [Plakobranchus ocellatus]|uniref:Maelstrom domain-containing protein n=1 Tax=Plakobranchus ocellatus TaxID=259542 RepID=A0AAV4BIU7_9GAST|nr:hypothetical protein PoB_004575700 [Plakobranchus ocellatus]
MLHMEERSHTAVRVKPEPSHVSEQTQEKIQPRSSDAPLRPPSKPMQVPSNASNGQTVQEEKEKKDEDPVDSESAKGIFGWETVDNTSIPYILRRGKKFVSVRIVERKLLSKYPNTFPDELGQKDPLVSHFITEAESKLLNEINTDHCDYEYGHNPFTTKDLIVDLDEFGDFFRIVKKTFPAEVLAKINAEVNLSSTTSLVMKNDLSQFCGWIQINNTVSPYILRFDGGKQTRLVPLSVIVYAAGLLNNASVEGLLPTPQECAMLNEACKIAGFDFSFGKNTRLISMAEVLQRCQVHLFDLPFKNPLQHARYIDPRTGQPSSNPLMAQVPQPQTTVIPPQATSPHIRPPFPHSASSDLSSGQMDSNPFMPQPPRHPAYPPPHLMLPSVASASQVSQAAAAAMFSPAGPLASLGIDALRAMGPRSQMVRDSKMLDSNVLPPRGIPTSMWNMMPRIPPPAHANCNPSSIVLKNPSNASVSTYQGQTGPQNSVSSAKNSSSMPDLAHPIFRGPLGMPHRMPLNQQGQRDNFGPMVRYPPPVTGLPPPPPQYSAPSSLAFGINQFNSSLFARTDLQDQRIMPGDARPGSSHHVSRRRSGESPKPNNVGNKARRQSSEPSHHMAQPAPGKNSLEKTDLKQRILACLVNGKSISCLHIDTPARRGRFCLVEAVSKLYFPAVPLQEFVKVLQVVLNINLLECTPEEEAAFVQYYNLPVSKLKCNKIIAVDDLDKFFPQLNYMFSKCTATETGLSSGQGSSIVSNTSTSTDRHKRTQSSPLSGPLPKQIAQPRLESVVQKLQHGKGYEHPHGEIPASTGAPVIIIDD